jgi:pyridoxal phosphate enzyme (YggS family)
MSVAENIARFKESAGAQPVTLIAVTKNATVLQIEEAFHAGVTEFGENRLQDAMSKRNQLPPHVEQNSKWHFIGHLQTNKARHVVGNFELIHSVDSLSLAKELSKAAVNSGLKQAILLQVKIAVDPTKFGFGAEELKDVFPLIGSLPNIEVKGLMTISPLVSDRRIWLDCFIGLRKLRDELEQKHGVKLKELSMGMSSDWPEAVSCGATMVRLGRAIFGN